ncbi:hypothetical protein BDZ97DRAFT_466016 [Flammula alnicola]|nr:hypothetical protein BDZ97DRAFT_466016 [Flammula alnicola]
MIQRRPTGLIHSLLSVLLLECSFAGFYRLGYRQASKKISLISGDIGNPIQSQAIAQASAIEEHDLLAWVAPCNWRRYHPVSSY